MAIRSSQHVSTKDQIVAKSSDFVIEYPDVSTFNQNYKVHHKILGQGAFGQVRRATNKANGEVRAVKIIDKLPMDDVERIRLKYEIDILKNLTHPNIVRLYEVYESKSTIHLVTELCEGRELFDEIADRDKLSEVEAAHVLKQLLQAVAYCHGQKIAHRDLKPENILIDVRNKGSIKVIDFGTSHHYSDEEHTMHQQYGTPYYIAPEVLVGTYTEKCDMWSIGVIIYIMLSGKPPFNAASEPEIMKKVKRGTWAFSGDVWSTISEDAKDLITKLMEKNVDKRISAVDALAHPWIKAQVKTRFNESLGKAAISNLQLFQVSDLCIMFSYKAG